MKKKTITDFVAAVNAHDTNRIAALLDEHHLSEDALTGRSEGKAAAVEAWQKCFESFPGYTLQLDQVAEEGDTAMAFGSTGNTGEKNWSLPAAFKAVIKEGKISHWLMIADARIAMESLVMREPAKPGVTGLGGVFFKCPDSKATKEWYKTHLGMATHDWGATFEWYHLDNKNLKGSTQWSPFAATTKYFEPSTKDFMINYRVENLDALLINLKAAGVTICDEIATYEYGKFLHIMDLDGNKVELWEAIDG